MSAPIIADIDLYKFHLWDLPEMTSYGERERYFFSPRDRKYHNGSRPNRAVGSGYWKATVTYKVVGAPKLVGIKKALVFYDGKAPRGQKTNWIMHEYRLADVDRSACRKNSLRLDDWVLCGIYNKRGSPIVKRVEALDNAGPNPETPEQKPVVPMLHAPSQGMDMVNFDTSDSVPRLHTASSCGSEHVLSPELAGEREVDSQPRWNEWDKALEISFNNGTAIEGVILSEFGAGSFEPGFRDPIQDILMNMQKPF